MTSTLLIDARHTEETRVAVTTDTVLDEFDYESAEKTQIKGNVYLAKVTRVEPSLQAAFVEYGGNRQGFLAFSEIHPDYYQIPVEDRKALLAEEAALAESDEGAENDKAEEPDQGKAAKQTEADEIIDGGLLDKRRIRALKRRYKIQEVIKKRQILLIQVVKEERGTKGAALTTYLSLPGRYCVLMPNTTHGNGISRKISDPKERQRLRKILNEFTVPKGMGCIIRTVGMGRTKAEIKRDFDYLSKTWAEIRETTLKAVAPTLIFEEGSLIKRSLRDIYDKHVKEVLVEGHDGFKLAKDFMKRLMPNHAKNIKEYKGKEPLFQKYGVEAQIDNLFTPVITLKSGGYIVINPTEALVAIDVNSGKATREHNIEETALQTNIEAAVEIARQLRLRDIAGLIVIDFIDMEEFSNVKAIERKFRDALKSDRARLFTSRISALGLLEMSRQRLRASLYEISTQPCPHCEASGRISSLSTLALRVFRQIEALGMEERHSHVLIQAPQELALFMLNSKRRHLEEVEQRFNVKVTVNPNVAMRMPHFEIKGLSEEQLQREMGASFLAAAGLADKTASQPNGFGKSDGRGHFPGKKRHRGKRGGQRQKFGHGGEKPRYQKDQRDAAKPEDARIASAKAEDASPAKQAVPEKGLDKKSPEKEAAKKAGKTPEKKTSRPKAATKRVEDKKEPKAKKAAPAPKTSEEKAGKKTKAPARQVKKAAPKAAESAAVKPKAKKTGPTRRGWWQKAVGGK
ncbi:MAG: Rne/Rng family ribonuclease [Proteobacteria bacterium]|nr:Rne/Rng family ribonuclease [Pseudomonadota bacterium]